MSRIGIRRVGPRNALERTVRSIWEEVLGHRDFGVLDSFDDVGGDSFTMVVVQAKIARIFGYEITLAALFSAPTIAGTAVLLRGGAASRPTPLVQLVREGDAAPVFCFHPLGGSAAIYAPLARALSARPCYGLQSLGLVQGHPPQRTLAEMVATYVDSILAVAPDGPHHLIGYSLGGRVALAAAHEIQRRGGEAATVFLLGAPTEITVDDREPYRAIGAYALHLDLDYDALAALGREGALSAIYAQAIREGVFGLDFAIERLATIFDTAFANMHAVAETPPRPFDGRLVLVYCDAETDGLEWRPYASSLTTYAVPFTHGLMLEEKAARRIAPLVDRHLPA